MSSSAASYLVLNSVIGMAPSSRAAPSPAAAPVLRIVLVEDRPDDLLEQVLHRDQAGGAAVLVEHHGQVGLEPLHVGQHVLDLAGPGHEERRAHDVPDRLVRAGAERGQDVLGVHHARRSRRATRCRPDSASAAPRPPRRPPPRPSARHRGRSSGSGGVMTSWAVFSLNSKTPSSSRASSLSRLPPSVLCSTSIRISSGECSRSCSPGRRDAHQAEQPVGGAVEQGDRPRHEPAEPHERSRHPRAHRLRGRAAPAPSAPARPG